MGVYKLFLVTLWSVLLIVVKCDKNEYQECFKKDSISCLQMKVFNNAKELLSQKSIDFIGGVSLIKEKDRDAKNLDLKNLEETVENSTDVSSRQVAIEKYLARKARDVMVTRTIQWNVGETARAISNAIPVEIKKKISDYVVEGRGKRKKLMKLIMPMLIGLKLKMVIVTIITFFGIALLAKKALLAAVLSLAISGYIGLKKLLAPPPPAKAVTYDDAGYHGSAGWNQVGSTYSGSNWPGYDNHADFSSSPGAQHLAYSGHKP